MFAGDYRKSMEKARKTEGEVARIRGKIIRRRESIDKDR
jgi:hypothetical protein